MATQLKQITLKKESNSYWRVIIENPPINMMDFRTVTELQEVINLLEANDQLNIVVFESANPDYFIAHFDLASPMAERPGPGPSGYSSSIDFMIRLAKLPALSVAAIRGRTRGLGCEFAYACDVRFGSRETAVLGQPEVGIGLFPGGGGIEHLPLLVGRARALEIILGSEDFDAVTAERYGWINRSIPDAAFVDFVDAFARRVASFDHQALAEAKRLINRAGLADHDAMVESQRNFFAAWAWEGAKRRVARINELGMGKHGDFELNMGKHLGNLIADNSQ